MYRRQVQWLHCRYNKIHEDGLSAWGAEIWRYGGFLPISPTRRRGLETLKFNIQFSQRRAININHKQINQVECILSFYQLVRFPGNTKDVLHSYFKGARIARKGCLINSGVMAVTRYQFTTGCAAELQSRIRKPFTPLCRVFSERNTKYIWPRSDMIHVTEISKNSKK